MLEQIRKHVHGWLSWVFLLCLVVVFILWGTVGLQLGSTDKYVDVNGEKIYPHQIEMFKRIYPNSDLAQVKLGMQQLNRSGYVFSEAQIDEVIKKMEIFQVNGKFSEELYENLINTNYRQLDMIREGAKFNGLIQQMIFSIQQANVLFPDVIENYYNLMDQKRKVSAVTVQNNKFLSEINLDNKELLAYYEANKNKFKAPVKIKLEYIRLNFADILKTINLTNQDLEDYYNKNSDQFTIPARKKISQIVINNKGTTGKEKLDKINAELKAGPTDVKKFTDLAKQYSDDMISVKQGGEIGWYQDGDMGYPEFDKAINKLTKVGDTTSALARDNDWYIFMLTTSEPKVKLSFEQVKSDLELKVKNEKANAAYIEKKEQLEHKSYEMSDGLDLVAKELKLQVGHTDWFSKRDVNLDGKAKNDLITDPKVVAAAFSEDVFENKNNSALIELNQESVVVIRVGEIQAERIKSFDEVKPVVTEDLKRIKAKQKANEFAKKLWQEFINASKSADKLESLAKKSSLVKYHPPIDVSYLDTFWAGTTTKNSYSKEELIQAFDLPKPNTDHPLQAKLVSLGDGSQSIVVINNVSLGNYSLATNEQKLQTENQLKYFMLMRDNANFFHRINRDNKIKSYL